MMGIPRLLPNGSMLDLLNDAGRQFSNLPATWMKMCGRFVGGQRIAIDWGTRVLKTLEWWKHMRPSRPQHTPSNGLLDTFHSQEEEEEWQLEMKALQDEAMQQQSGLVGGLGQ